ncbi:hypothetical protein [Cardinium endosymbiont of Philonthus spinipes]|uniref:hypothetical protein n=1 Tax=Cardinium endosymbiont of Philonthus spinipes TaxID=3077941 RepID=UPI00313EEE55
MTTKRIQYRSSLFIWLLGLNTLSSCINTRRELGVDNSSDLVNQYEEEDHAVNNLQSDSEQLLSANGSFSRQAEQSDNRDHSQEANRFSLVSATFRSAVDRLAEAPVENILWICGVTYGLSYALGYIRGYTPGYADGLLYTLPRI